MCIPAGVVGYCVIIVCFWHVCQLSLVLWEFVSLIPGSFFVSDLSIVLWEPCEFAPCSCEDLVRLGPRSCVSVVPCTVRTCAVWSLGHHLGHALYCGVHVSLSPRAVSLTVLPW